MKKESRLRHFCHKTWHFIWHDNSIWSWIANLIIAFILIKYIVYPAFGFILGTNYPIVAVVSGSMEHKVAKDNFGYLRLCDKTYSKKFSVDFDKWWDVCGHWYIKNTDITKEQFKDFPFRNGFNTGDIMILYSANKLKTGDIIVFNSNTHNDPIIHRVVAIENGNIFITKGDHNQDKDTFINPTLKEEVKINQERVLGKAIFRIPILGWIKIGFVELLGLMGVI